MIALLDHYDSFTHNLAHLIACASGELPRVLRCDAVSSGELLAMKPRALVLSPGPGAPGDRGIALDILRRAPATLPILAVCLGHQTLAVSHGGQLCRVSDPVHGECSEIDHEGKGLFRGLPSPLRVMRYHSLAIDEATLPQAFAVTARLRQTPKLIMGIEHRMRPWFGVQFHPESFLSEGGVTLLLNFFALTS